MYIIQAYGNSEFGTTCIRDNQPFIEDNRPKDHVQQYNCYYQAGFNITSENWISNQQFTGPELNLMHMMYTPQKIQKHMLLQLEIYGLKLKVSFKWKDPQCHRS